MRDKGGHVIYLLLQQPKDAISSLQFNMEMKRTEERLGWAPHGSCPVTGGVRKRFYPDQSWDGAPSTAPGRGRGAEADPSLRLPSQVHLRHNLPHLLPSPRPLPLIGEACPIACSIQRCQTHNRAIKGWENIPGQERPWHLPKALLSQPCPCARVHLQPQRATNSVHRLESSSH